MAKIQKNFVILALLVFLQSGYAFGEPIYRPGPPILSDEKVTIQTHDGRDLIYFIDRPEIDTPLPLLVLVDGSGCVGQKRPQISDFYRPVEVHRKIAQFARLRVEKPGVGHADDWPQESCSEDFLKHYTVDKRVEDHLRVLQHLRASADWWNGEVLIFGWSDGGDIGTRLLAYYPDVTRAVLGGMGGGIPMAQHFEEDWICSDAAQVGDHEGCVASLRKEFQRMADNPTWKRTWSGEDNSWRVWASRLFSTTTALLVDNHTPVLIVHGQEDFDSLPVRGARKLVEELTAAGNDAFEYWEVVGMKHSLSSLEDEARESIEICLLLWLVASEDAIWSNASCKSLLSADFKASKR